MLDTIQITFRTHLSSRDDGGGGACAQHNRAVRTTIQGDNEWLPTVLRISFSILPQTFSLFMIFLPLVAPDGFSSLSSVLARSLLLRTSDSSWRSADAVSGQIDCFSFDVSTLGTEWKFNIVLFSSLRFARRCLSFYSTLSKGETNIARRATNESMDRL